MRQLKMTTLEPQLIIVDGLDRCGKSTFIEYLRQKYPDTCPMILHSTKPPDNLEDPKQYQMDYYKNQIKHIKELIQEYEFPVIIDRFHLGEFVYGTIYRNCEYCPEELSELEKPLQDVKTTLYVFTDSTDKRLDRDDGKSLTTNPDLMESEYNLFQKWYKYSTIKNKVFVNWCYEPEFSAHAFDQIIERAYAPVE